MLSVFFNWKTGFVLLVCSLFLIFSISNINAQTTPLKVEIYKSVQNPVDKSFKILAEVESRITSERVSAVWILPPGLESEDDVSNNDLVLKEGTNRFEITVIPIAEIDEGRISVTIQSFESDSRFSSTQSAEINVNEELQLLPVSQEYSTLFLILGMRDIAWYLFLAAIITYLVTFLIRKFGGGNKAEGVKSQKPIDSEIIKELSELKRRNEI